MAQGENAEKRGHPGKEYWKSRLHRYGEIPGKFTKRLTHKKERRLNTSEEQKAIAHQTEEQL